jgi:5-methylcytosine-specific restriction endonuclease McrA
MIPAFPKPSQIKKKPEAVKVFRDGREVCNQLTKPGRDEYARRRRLVFDQQKGICAICHLPIRLEDLTCDHIKPRKSGGSETDDRIENLAAVHWKCNIERGSKRSGYYGVP